MTAQVQADRFPACHLARLGKLRRVFCASSKKNAQQINYPLRIRYAIA